jgi:hypothetical protein
LCEGAARFERAGVLQKLELHHERRGIEAEILRVDRDRRRMPHIRPDQPFDGGDPVALDRPLRLWHDGGGLHCGLTIRLPKELGNTN